MVDITVTVSNANANMFEQHYPNNILCICQRETKQKLLYIDPELLAYSDHLKKNCKLVKKTELLEMFPQKSYLLDSMVSEVLIVVIPFNYKLLTNPCESIDEFYEVLKVFDMYIFNTEILDYNVKYMLWLENYKKHNELFWNNNPIYSSKNIDKKQMGRKFDGAIAQQYINAVPGYPLNDDPNANKKPSLKFEYINFHPDTQKKLENILDLFLLRFENYQKVFEILYIMGTNIETAHVLLSPRIVERLSQVRFKDIIIFYMMRILYFDEIFLKYKLKASDRCIIDWETARLLIDLNIKQKDCFLPIFVNNTWAMRSYTSSSIVSNIEFNHRYKEYTGGYLDKINWNKTVLCGSSLLAIVVKSSLEGEYTNYTDYLRDLYKPTMNCTYKEKINTYPGNRKSKFQFVGDSSSSESDENANIGCIGIESDIDIMIETTDYGEFDKIAESHYQSILESIRDSSLPTYGEVRMEKVYTENKYKYIITGLHRKLEIFFVDSIPGTINKFHLPCVRMWYDGKSVKMLPSFISCIVTGICMDTRWISCNKDLKDVIMKYYYRGYATALGVLDRLNMYDFVNASEKYVKVVLPTFDPNNARGWVRRQHFFDTTKTTIPTPHRVGPTNEKTRRQNRIIKRDLTRQGIVISKGNKEIKTPLEVYSSIMNKLQIK